MDSICSLPLISSVCDAISAWWNDPLWSWLGWGVLILAVLAVIHWLLSAARPLTGPGILATLAALIGYFFGRRDQKRKQKIAQAQTQRRQEQQQQWNPFDWWFKK